MNVRGFGVVPMMGEMLTWRYIYLVYSIFRDLLRGAWSALLEERIPKLGNFSCMLVTLISLSPQECWCSRRLRKAKEYTLGQTHCFDCRLDPGVFIVFHSFYQLYSS